MPTLFHHLSVQIMESGKTQADRNRCELQVAQQALEHYRRPLELERKLQGQ
jgi:hypothetical protein